MTTIYKVIKEVSLKDFNGYSVTLFVGDTLDVSIDDGSNKATVLDHFAKPSYMEQSFTFWVNDVNRLIADKNIQLK